jgi:glutaconate CoA-transferase subunit A
VKPGDTVAFGGILNTSHPMPVIRELIRLGTGDLHVVGIANGLELDMLIAAGLVRRVSTPTISGESIHPGAGPAFRRVAQRDEIEVSEVDEAIVEVALQAAAQRLPFAPWLGGLGTSLPEVSDDLVEISSPFDDRRVLAVRALPLDVAFLHVGRSDLFGNVQPVGGGFGDKAMARAAKLTFCTVERIVGNEEIRANPSQTMVAGVDGIVQAPFGSHPFASPGFYLPDAPALREYVAAAQTWYRQDDRGPLDAYLDQWLSGPEDHWEYLRRVGPERLYGLEEGILP